jgi:tRNA (guanine-N7-)-methyltransferase
LYAYTLEVIKEEGHHLMYADDDIYTKPLVNPFLEIKTYYEGMHLAEGRKIKYVAFKLKS